MNARRASFVLSALLVASGTLVPSQANAAFPGFNGRIFYSTQRDGSGDIWSVDPSAAAPTFDGKRVTNGGLSDEEPFSSPDGKKIVFQRVSADSVDNSDVRIVLASNNLASADPNVSADGSVSLTNDPAGSDKNPSWYSDSRYVVVDRIDATSGQRQLVKLDSLNIDPPTPIFPAALYPTGTGSCDTRGVVNPANNNQIAFVRGCLSTTKIYLYDTSTPALAPINLSGANTSDTKPDWHPSGLRLVFVTRETGVSKIAVMDSAGGNRSLLWNIGAVATTPDTDPAYSPAGDNLTWARRTTAGANQSLDVFTGYNTQVASDGLPTGSAGSLKNVTPQDGVRDEMPVWAPQASGPDPVIPEAPYALLLPLTGVALAGVTFMFGRDRRRTVRV